MSRPPDIGERHKDDWTWFGVGLIILAVWITALVVIVAVNA